MPLFTRFSSTKTPTNNDAHGFSVEDKPVPLMGKILLIIMFLLLLSLGWRGLSDIYHLLPAPPSISSCLRQLTTTHSAFESSYRPPTDYQYQNLNTYDSNQDCLFSPLEEKYQTPQVYRQYQQAKINYDTLQDQLKEEQNSLATLQRNLNQKQREYNLSLQEIQANAPTTYHLDSLQNNISSLESSIAAGESQITRLNAAVQTESQSLLPFETRLTTIGTQIAADYNRSWALYRLYVFLLQLIFVVPIFFLSFKLYWRYKRQDSPYTLIVVPIVAVSAVLLARIFVSYVWTLFLADILEVIWEVIQNIALFRILLFYLGMLLVIVIFGGAVYLLQRKIFHPLRVQKRRLKKNTCPFCETPLSLSKKYCPECSKQLRSTCAHCQQLRLDILPYCPHCGQQT